MSTLNNWGVVINVLLNALLLSYNKVTLIHKHFFQNAFFVLNICKITRIQVLKYQHRKHLLIWQGEFLAHTQCFFINNKLVVDILKNAHIRDERRYVKHKSLRNIMFNSVCFCLLESLKQNLPWVGWIYYRNNRNNEVKEFGSIFFRKNIISDCIHKNYRFSLYGIIIIEEIIQFTQMDKDFRVVQAIQILKKNSFIACFFKEIHNFVKIPVKDRIRFFSTTLNSCISRQLNFFHPEFWNCRPIQAGNNPDNKNKQQVRCNLCEKRHWKYRRNYSLNHFHKLVTRSRHHCLHEKQYEKHSYGNVEKGFNPFYRMKLSISTLWDPTRLHFIK